MDRRIGKFYLPGVLVASKPEMVAEIFYRLKIVPYQVGYLAYMGEYEYIAICEKFRYIPIGESLPEYKLKITESEDGKDIELVEILEIPR